MRREGGQVRAAEAGRRGSVGHVEVFRMDGVGTSIVGRPRRLPADRRARPTYTLIWEKPVIGDRDSAYSPAKTSPAQTEKSIEERLAEHLRVQVGSKTRVAQQVGTWSGATTADIVVYATDDRSSIDQVFEVKAGRGTVDDVYQLVCQWDGFVRDGMSPREGVLYCKSSDHKPATAVADLNGRKGKDGKRYNLRMSHHATGGIASATPAKKTTAKKTTAKKTTAKKTTAKKTTAKKTTAKKTATKKTATKKTATKKTSAKKTAAKKSP